MFRRSPHVLKPWMSWPVERARPASKQNSPMKARYPPTFTKSTISSNIFVAIRSSCIGVHTMVPTIRLRSYAGHLAASFLLGSVTTSRHVVVAAPVIETRTPALYVTPSCMHVRFLLCSETRFIRISSMCFGIWRYRHL